MTDQLVKARKVDLFLGAHLADFINARTINSCHLTAQEIELLEEFKDYIAIHNAKYEY